MEVGSVRDDLLAYVAEHLGHDDGVLIVDETGLLKKGIKSARGGEVGVDEVVAGVGPSATSSSRTGRARFRASGFR
ncbi:hypothetical protein [Micromonospora sp. NPDC049891]|uniref:hypothetical protein n=1 Tax=Micromonospora sp. NPDC049891 TaxID=3155655 RepID=UPI0033EAAC93